MNRGQTIILTNDGIVHRRIYASLALVDEYVPKMYRPRFIAMTRGDAYLLVLERLRSWKIVSRRKRRIWKLIIWFIFLQKCLPRVL